MVWEISISPEGWDEIYQELQRWSRDRLIMALEDDFYEVLTEYGIESSIAEDMAKQYAASLHKYASHEALIDEAFELVQTNNTCDNGGYHYWIDRRGYHKVTLTD